MKRSVALAAALTLLSSAATAAVVTYDFDTNQSASFTVIEVGDAGESSANFAFDYSTHDQNGAFIDVAIPSAPDSVGATTLGLQFQTNSGPGGTSLDAICAYPDVTGLDLSGGNWVMTFNVWSNHNGDAGGGSGSTLVVNFGAAADTTLANAGNYTLVNGFMFGMTGDGGSGTDYRYYEGNPAAPQHAIGNFWGANAINNSATGWTTFFPNDGTLGTPPTGAVNAGAPGKQWVTVRLTVSNAGATRELALKKSGDAGFTVVSTVAAGVGAFARPSVGMNDINGTFPSADHDDNFFVIDNLVIDDLAVTSVNEWSVYN